MEIWQKELMEALPDGQALFDPATRRAYSVDASIYEIEPLGIVIPQKLEELQAVLDIAHFHKIAITPRGAATGITGGCLGEGLIVDLSKYFTNILDVNYAEEYAICQPGVIQDQLNALLARAGYRLGPDTSTGNRATIGGMLANNAAGARSLRYGKMVDHVMEVDLKLASGETLQLGLISDEEALKKAALKTREGTIYRTALQIRQEYREEISHHFPKLPRRVSGYNLDELTKSSGINLSKLIAGSEGTLGIATAIKLKICPKPSVTFLCLIQCTDMLAAMQYLPQMLTHDLFSLEMIDDKIIAAGCQYPALKDRLNWLEGSPQAVYVAEFEGKNSQIAEEKAHYFMNEMKKFHFGYSFKLLKDIKSQESVWGLRKAGLGLLLSRRTYSRAVAFIEDISIAPPMLFSFMSQFMQLLKSFGKQAGIYGHVGSGCMHLRPYFDLSDPSEQKLMEKMMLAVADLLLAHGGALSGEHGDGYIRSWLNEKMFGSKLYQAFCQLKEAFDPLQLLNPGKIVHSPLPLHDLRSQKKLTLHTLPSFLDFNEEGGLALSADLCNGNGLCRKKEGVMCPSFQVTNDEYDTTRARAQAFRAIVQGHWPQEALAGEELHDILDLCIQCKGCKSECPSQVDMAKMKSEALYHYHQKHGLDFRSWLFGHIGAINRWLIKAPRLANILAESYLGKKIFSIIGIAEQRSFPRLAKKPFSRWHQKKASKKEAPSNRVLLFSDTFTEFNHPEIGMAAVKVLEALNYQVITPKWVCCGRTLFSKGMLKQAKRQAKRLISQLAPFAHLGIPIIGLEPSCLFMITEDFKALMGGDAEYVKVQTLACTFEGFLKKHLIQGRLPLPLINTPVNLLVHMHCHQKAYEGNLSLVELLQALPGCRSKLLDTGCCGMAGSFGFEKEHYSFSLKIGNLKLFPELKQASLSDLIVANGISCRQQIAEGTGLKALHLAEFLASRLAQCQST